EWEWRTPNLMVPAARDCLATSSKPVRNANELRLPVVILLPPWGPASTRIVSKKHATRERGLPPPRHSVDHRSGAEADRQFRRSEKLSYKNVGSLGVAGDPRRGGVKHDRGGCDEVRIRARSLPAPRLHGCQRPHAGRVAQARFGRVGGKAPADRRHRRSRRSGGRGSAPGT